MQWGWYHFNGGIQMKVLGIMLIRSGSTRLPNKNFMQFGETSVLFPHHPLFRFVLEQMILSDKMDQVIISTDIPEKIKEKLKDIKIWHKGEDTYIKYFEKFKIINRPKYLCEENSKSEDALIWTVREFDDSFDTIVLIQCTTPLLRTKHIDIALYHFEKNRDRYLSSLISVNKSTMKPNGALYIVDREALLKYGTYFTPRTGIYLMSPQDSVDIDYLYDFRIAEAVARGDIFE